MEKLIWGVFALLLIVFLGACPHDDPGTPEVPSGRVGAPVIGKDPRRNYNEKIEISFTSSTPNAEFYYTLDGSAPSPDIGVKYNGPFPLESGNEYIRNTPNPGSIQVRVIGIKEGLRDSSISSQNFQIFRKELIKDGNGDVIPLASATGTGVGGYHSSSQNVLVTVTVTNGLITAAYQNGYNDTTLHTPEYWNVATAHADQFLSTMNSWEFDTVTGASRSSQAIKDGLEKAMFQILKD
jgi:uncharacterized protein with FMN-binding domain